MTLYEIIHLIITLAMLALFIAIAVDFWWRFTHAVVTSGETPTLFDRFLSAGRGSITFWWGLFVTSIGALAGGLANLADFFNEPSVADGIKTFLTPTNVAIFTIVVGIITVIARRRTMSS